MNRTERSQRDHKNENNSTSRGANLNFNLRGFRTLLEDSELIDPQKITTAVSNCKPQEIRIQAEDTRYFSLQREHQRLAYPHHIDFFPCPSFMNYHQKMNVSPALLRGSHTISACLLETRYVGLLGIRIFSVLPGSPVIKLQM